MLVAIGRSGFSTIDYRNIANRPYGALSHRGHIFDGQKLTYRGAAYHATAYAQLQGNVGLWIDTYCMSRGGEACASTIREHRYYYERASFVAIAMDELTEDLVCRLGDMVTDPIRSALSLKTRSLCQYSDTQLSAFAQYFSGSDVMRSGWCAQEILSGQELAIFTDCGRVMEWPAVAAGLAYIHATSIYQRTAAARLVELRLHRKSFTTNWWPLHDLLIACKDVDNVDRLDILAGYVSENLEYACERTTETVRTWLCETLVFRSPEIMLLQGYNSVTPGEGWFGKLCDPESGSVEMPLGDMSNIDIKVCFVARSIGIRVYCRYMKLPTYTTKARKEGDDVELANVGGQKAVGWLHAPSVESNECLYLLLVGFSSSSLYAVVVDTSLSKRVGGCVVENDGSNMFDVSSWEKSEFTIA
ncbi:hypothetical protein BGX28_004254 [Mortierella sp. GBA30]|nr:hypothetical protein BGX28_004254 [Mortierella sp. GBA30]